VTAVDIIAQRVAPFWLADGKLTGDPTRDAASALSQRYRKADGTSLTQFNTGALVIREDCVLALTECQPNRRDASLHIGPATKSRNTVIEDIRQNGPPLLAVLFRKGAIDVASRVCSTPDEVVLNGPAGPEVAVMMEDVALLRGLKGSLGAWRSAASLYAQATADLSVVPKLHQAVDKLAVDAGEDSSAVLECLHRLHRVDRLSYELADPVGRRRE
jgi:hypothetical protein